MNIKTMDNNQLFKAVVESQSAMKSELLGEIKKIDHKLDKEVVGLRQEIQKGFSNLIKRVDRLEKYQNFATA